MLFFIQISEMLRVVNEKAPTNNNLLMIKHDLFIIHLTVLGTSARPVYVRSHWRIQNGKRVHVKAHWRKCKL